MTHHPAQLRCKNCIYYTLENECLRLPQTVSKEPAQWCGEFRSENGQTAWDVFHTAWEQIRYAKLQERKEKKRQALKAAQTKETP